MPKYNEGGYIIDSGSDYIIRAKDTPTGLEIWVHQVDVSTGVEILPRGYEPGRNMLKWTPK